LASFPVGIRVVAELGLRARVLAGQVVDRDPRRSTGNRLLTRLVGDEDTSCTAKC
jgi:hypothetical protein